MNEKLRQARIDRRWSVDYAARRIGIGRTTYMRWEQGTQNPHDSSLMLACKAFNLSPEQLGFAGKGSGNSKVVKEDLHILKENETQPHIHEYSEEKRATVLLPEQPENTRSSLYQSPIVALPWTTAMNDSINERLDQAERMINLAWDAWFASRPAQATREVTRLLPALERAVTQPLAAVHMLRAKELVIRCHGLLGTMYVDALHNDAALYHYIQAHTIAQEIHDPDLTATYLALVGDVIRRQNDKATAISYMEQAREIATAPATSGHVLQLLAYAYGDIGNEMLFERTIGQATDLLAFTGEGRDTDKREFIPFELYEIRGKANRDLGKPLKAIPFLELAEKSLYQAESVTPRWHALLEISRGQAFCDAGDISLGVEVASKGFLLAYECHSPRQMNRVRKLLRKLEEGPWKHERKIDELRALVHEIYLRVDLEK